MGFPTAVYSPKHRLGRCILTTTLSGSPQGHRRLRFSFFLHLSKSRSRLEETRRRTSSPHPHHQCRDPEASIRTTTPWPPSMKMYLAKLVSDVNNNFEVFFSSFFRSTNLQYSRQTSSFAEMKSSLRLLSLRGRSPPEDLHFPSEEPGRLAMYWQSGLVASIRFFESS